MRLYDSGRPQSPIRQLAAFSMLILVTACIGQERAGLGTMNIVSQGVINDPANKSLRFDILRFGLEHFCFEMQRRGVALKVRDEHPVSGRFFATSCQSQLLKTDGRQTIAIRYSGLGYGWTNLTGRIGFQVQGFVEYSPDFKLHGDSMYIYFRSKNVDATQFKTEMIESQLGRAGLAVSGLNADQLGKDLVLGQLRRGFTVIRQSENGDTEFAVGLSPIGSRPVRPFTIVSSDKRTLDNDRTELHSGQQDYIGAFQVEADGMALSLTLTLDGADAMDVLIVPEGIGAQLLRNYSRVPGPAIPRAAIASLRLTNLAPLRESVPVPPGGYYLLLDHSAQVGTAKPPAGADRPARVDYLIQVGDRP